MTDKRRHEGRRGLLIDFGAGTDLLEYAIAHDGDPIAHRQGFFLIMRDIDERNIEFFLIAPDLHFHFRPQFAIEIGKRLIQEQQSRP